MKFIEKIRNEIAHSQNSIISGLEWEDFVHTLSFTRTFLTLSDAKLEEDYGNDSNLLIVFYVQIMPDDFVMQLHR
ncbi:hypothetical protein M8R73_22410, partial [Enterobacter roggenkampii]|nr:hypothetical protein [Enterobacter roggenkampii]